jgi:RNA polymerase sigma-70 factor (ECF subfamily)
VSTFAHLNSAEFVARATSGDSDAFHELFDALAGHLATFIERRGASASDAEEIAADAMVKVHRGLRTYRADGGAKLTTWIFEIASRCAIDHHRARARRIEEQTEITRESKRAAAPETIILGNPSDREQFAAAFQSLRESDRDLMRMRQVMEYSEIADAEQATEQAVRVRYKRALDRLKAIIETRRSHGHQQA